MKTIIDLGILLVIILMMTAVGLDLEPRHFREMARQKRALILCLIVQPVLLPLLALILIRGASLPPHLSASILLLAACPNGDIVNYYTWLARANVALAVTMTLMSLLLAAITMPIIFEIYARALGGQFPFAVPPLRLIGRLTLMLVAPVSCGMIIRRLRPGFPEKYGKSLRHASLLGVALLMISIMVAQAEQLTADWRHIALASAALIVTSLLLGLGVSRMARFNASDTLTIAITFAARNAALAVVIAVTLLHRIEFAAFATVYFLTEMPFILAAVALYRWNFRHDFA